MSRLETLLGKAMGGDEKYGSAEALEPTIGLIDGAEKNICILGDLDELNNPEIIEALKRANERRVPIIIAHGPETTGESDGIVQLGREKIVKLHPLEDRPAHHFVLVDGKHVIAEELHGPGEDKQVFFKRNPQYLGTTLWIEFQNIIKK